MRTPARILEHPRHLMLIAFKIGLYSMVGDFIGALCAAMPGLINLIYRKVGAPLSL